MLKKFNDMLKAFGVVTVMNVRIYPLNEKVSYVGHDAAFTPNDFNGAEYFYIDTLKIANMNQEGPTKTVTGGQYANPLIKYGKTMTMEMQDALGSAKVLKTFFGCDYDETTGVVSVTDKFAPSFAMEGQTYFIDQKTGEKVTAYIFIPQFQPDSLLNLTQDAEGDATVFDLNGSINATKIRTDVESEAEDATWDPAEDDTKSTTVFYQIRPDRWFKKYSTTGEGVKA